MQLPLKETCHKVEENNQWQKFRNGKADILVATDVASRGNRCSKSRISS